MLYSDVGSLIFLKYSRNATGKGKWNDFYFYTIVIYLGSKENIFSDSVIPIMPWGLHFI